MRAPQDKRGNRKNLETLFDEVVDDIRDHNIKKFLQWAIRDNASTAESFFTAPGARSENPGHHAFEGGLAYHTLTAAKLAGQIVDHYRSLGMHPKRDVVVAGVILHDIGKAWCYEWGQEEKDGEVVWKYKHTKQSKLHHHIPMGYAWLIEKAQVFNTTSAAHELTRKKIDHLGHIILSHHGRRSWSSPVTPNTIEAYIVHVVEMMDAFVDKFNKGYDVRDLYDH